MVNLVILKKELSVSPLNQHLNMHSEDGQNLNESIKKEAVREDIYSIKDIEIDSNKINHLNLIDEKSKVEERHLLVS